MFTFLVCTQSTHTHTHTQISPRTNTCLLYTQSFDYFCLLIVLYCTKNLVAVQQSHKTDPYTHTRIQTKLRDYCITAGLH